MKKIDHTLINSSIWRIKWRHRQVDKRIEDRIYLSVQIGDNYHGTVGDGSFQNVDKVRIPILFNW